MGSAGQDARLYGSQDGRRYSRANNLGMHGDEQDGIKLKPDSFRERAGTDCPRNP